MPAIMTHDFFGKDVYDDLFSTVGSTHDESEAFLLGNQGPDPLFYLLISPRLIEQGRLGSTMHNSKPNELLYAMKQSLSVLSESEKPIGRAYALGFLCHYTLDSSMHPLVFFQEYLACDAGIDELSRANGNEVHGTIESEFDEMVLYAKRGETIATYSPASNVLHGTDNVLRIISKMYAYVALTVYGMFASEKLYSTAVRNFRLTQGIFYSRSGAKRAVVSRIEERFRRYSFFGSMSHRPLAITESKFGNHEHETWENPFTGTLSTDSFWDIYEAALVKAKSNIAAFLDPRFDLDAATKITNNLDFSGEPTVATLTIEKDRPAGCEPTKEAASASFVCN